MLIFIVGCTHSNQGSMGFWDKLFGKKQESAAPSGPIAPRAPIGKVDVGSLEKTAELLHEDQFWAIVERSLKFKDDQEKQEAFLVREVEQLSPKEMVGFDLRTKQLLRDSYNGDLWCAAYIMNGGCSDDGFEYFRCWLISRGRKVYEAAMANPDNLITEVAEDNGEGYDFESFSYIAQTAFENKTGKDLNDYIDNEQSAADEGGYPELVFQWKEEDPESMRKICPRLYAQCWEKYGDR